MTYEMPLRKGSIKAYKPLYNYKGFFGPKKYIYYYNYIVI